MKLFRIILMLVISVFLPLLLLSQSNISNLNFIHHKTGDGLAQRKVKSIAQDSLGYMWFGTEAGINRFNGYTYKVYDHELTNDNFVTSNDVNLVFADSNGDVWFDVINGGLHKIEIAKEKLTDYYKLDSLSWHKEDIFNDILERSNGDIFLLSVAALYKLSPQNGNYNTEKYEWNKNGEQVLDLYRLHSDNQNRIWVSTYDGELARFDNGHFIDHTSYINNADINIKEIRDLASDKQNNLLIATFDQGIVRYNPQNKTVHSINVPDLIDNNESNCQVSKIIPIDGNIWVGTMGCGLYVFDNSLRSFKHFKHSTFYEKSLANNFVNDIYVDRDHSIWIGTSGGVDLVSETNVSQIKNTYSKHGLSDEDVLSVEEDNEGFIWIGTRNGGLNRFDLNAGDFKYFVKEEKNAASLSNNSVEAIFEDSRNRLWVGTRNGLNLYQRQTNTFKSFKNIPGDENSLVFNTINYITEDKDGFIWIGTDGGGVSRFDPSEKSFQNFRSVLGDSSTLSNNVVRIIHQDHKGNIWVGTYHGLNKYDKQSQSFKTYLPDNKDTTSLSVPGVVSMLTDHINRLWVGTYGGGLLSYNYENDAFYRITKKDGLAGNFIYSINEDTIGNIWLSTESGVSKIKFDEHDLTQHIITNFSKDDGFSEDEFTYANYYSRSKNLMFYGTSSGLNMFNPQKLKSKNPETKILLSDLLIFNEKVAANDEFKLLQKNFSLVNSIEIPYKYKLITINFTGLNYFEPDHIDYSYRLIPLTTEWISSTDMQYVTFANMEPGNYQFQVKALNNKSNIETPPKTLNITIIPPFWKTLWFRIIALVLIAGIALSIYLWRIRDLKKKNLDLETKVQERTQDLQYALMDVKEKNEEIAAQNEELTAQFEEISLQRDQIQEINKELNIAHSELKSINEELDERVHKRTAELVKTNQELDRFVYSASHDLSAPIKSILGVLNITKYLDKNKELKEHLDHIEKSVVKLEDVIKSLSQFSRNMGYNVIYKNYNLKEIVNEILEELSAQYDVHNAEVDLNFHEAEQILTDYFRLKIIMTNLISNAFKYKDDKNKFRIEILYEKSNNMQVIKVNDNGPGIEPALQENIFDMFFRGNSSSEGSGLGLYIVKETLRKLNGSIKLESQPGEFTVFTIELPVNSVQNGIA